jgi:hypothetical protein
MQRLNINQLRYRILQENRKKGETTNVRSGEFKEQLVLRAIYQVGSDAPTLASYTGYSKAYVTGVMRRRGKEAMKALRAYVNAEDHAPTVKDTLKTVSHSVGQFIKRRLFNRKAK